MHIYIYIYIYIYLPLPYNVFLNIQKNRSQKLGYHSLSMKKNQDSFGICIEFRTKL